MTDSVATGLKSALRAAWLAEVWLEWEQSVFAQAAREVVKRLYERLDAELAKVRDAPGACSGCGSTLVTPRATTTCSSTASGWPPACRC